MIEPDPRQTAICDTLPHAATIQRLTNNWRAAADAFLEKLEWFGYTIVPTPDRRLNAWRFPTNRPDHLGTWQHAHCGRCGSACNDAEPHLCIPRAAPTRGD